MKSAIVHGVSGLALLLGAAQAPAQTTARSQTVTPAQTQPADEEDLIVVNGDRERGAVLGTIKPDIQLDVRDIRAYGVASIADLVAELSPQTTSGRGRGGEAPAILVNGKRISGFAEIRNLPPEAVERVDIMPEEVSLKYGFKSDQKVINFVLRRRFRALTSEIEAGGPTTGGKSTLEGQSNWLRLRGDSRISVDGKYTRDSRLLESERNITSPSSARPFDLAGNITALTTGAEIDPALSALVGKTVTVAAVPDDAATAGPGLGGYFSGANNPDITDIRPYRTLLPATQALSIGTTFAGLGMLGASVTITAGIDASSSNSLQGLQGVSLTVPQGSPYSPFAASVLVNRYVDGPLAQNANTWSGRFGLTLNGQSGRWQWSTIGNYVHSENRINIDRGLDLTATQARLNAGDPILNPFGILTGGALQDRASSNSESGDLDFVLIGSPLALPAGDMAMTLKAGVNTLSLNAESLRFTSAGLIQRNTRLARTQGNYQGSFDLPITSVKNDVLPALGNLSLNLNLAINQLSDFGTLTTVGYGFNWAPAKAIGLIGSATQEEGPPTIQQLGNPLTNTPGVRVFDFIRGQTVDITRIDGGNAALTADHRRVYKLGLTVKPLAATDLTLLANFTATKIRNPIASFPTATAELEAAFPDRFVRDASGRLISIDNRPVNFKESDQKQLRWGVNLSLKLKASAAELAAAAARRTEFEARRAAIIAAGGSPGGASGVAAGRRPGSAPGGPGRGGPPGGFSGFGGGPEGRLQLSIFHTWQFQNRIQIRDGVPALDLLNGSATGSSGGSPRHQIEARAGISKAGLGARFSLNWQSATQVSTDPSGATTSPDDLRFSGLATLGLRLFADMGQQQSLVKRARWLRGARISLAVTNLTDAKLDVRDRSGSVPIGYQRDLLDPLGRTVTISFRKLLF